MPRLILHNQLALTLIRRGWMREIPYSYLNCENEMKMKKWSSQWTQFMQSRKEAWKKFRTSYIINTHFFHGNIWTHNWPAPNVSGLIAQLVKHRTGNSEVTGSNPVEVLNSFRLLYAIHGNYINCVHCDDHFFIFISFPQFRYDLFHISLTIRYFSHPSSSN